VEIGVPREQVYGALTTAKGLAGWWTTQVKADTSVGGIVDCTFA
jgi:uncharacterized protein YndB with AHSA1/START domain